jgi:hypothetical protein
MPCKTTWERRGILWEFYGHVTGDEIDKVNDRFFKDERRHDVSYQLIDATGVTSTEWTGHNADLIAAKDFGASHEVENLKLAFVVAEPGFEALVDEYIALSERLNSTWTFRRFDDIKSARNWVDPPDITAEIRCPPSD